MRVWLLSIFIASSGILLAQNTRPQKPSNSALKTFTSPDGSFRFRYPSLLVNCEKRQQGDQYVWVQKECTAYHPVCGDGLPSTDVLACVAYPRNRYSNTGAFEAAAFSVSKIRDVSTNKVCGAGSDYWSLNKRPGTATIAGGRFKVFEIGDSAMNQSGNATIYRSFHGGECYQLGIAWATASPQVFDPPAKELTKADETEITHRLEHARDSFRFLK